MEKAILVYKVNPLDCLNEILKSELFRNSLAPWYVMKQIFAGYELHYNVDVSHILQMSVHTHNFRVF